MAQEIPVVLTMKLYVSKYPAIILKRNQISKIGTEKKLYLKRFGVNARQYILASLDNYLSEESQV